MGGNLATSTQTCADKNQEAVTLGLNTQKTLIDTINNLRPAGIASLGDAIKLSRNIFEKKQGNIQKKLFMFLGGGDNCSTDKWVALKYFLKDYKESLSINVATEVVILPDESIDLDLVTQLQDDIKRLGLEKEVNVQAPKNDQELQTVVVNIYNQTITQARPFEPRAVAVQQTANAINTAPPKATVTMSQITLTKTLPQPSITQAQITATSTPIFTVVIQPPSTPLPPPTMTPTVAPPTPIPPSPNTPSPSIVLLSATYVGSGEGCSAVINFQVNNGDVTGYFRVWNKWYDTQSPPFDPKYPLVVLPVGPNGYQVGLGGNGNPDYYRHKVWFEYTDGTSSNPLADLICPNLTPSP